MFQPYIGNALQLCQDLDSAFYISHHKIEHQPLHQ